jgi:FkbM family methyltransferase
MGDPMTRKPAFRTARLFLHRILNTQVARIGTVRLNTNPADIPRSLRTAIFKGLYELPERQLVEASVRQGDRVLEIGTGIGFISILCSQRTGVGQVLSYEANPALRPAIEGNYRLNGLTPNLKMRAVTVKGQPISFFQNANVISSSLLDRENDARKITVESDPINEVIAAHRPDVIVMDVEGAEIDLLTAADLPEVRSIVVETHDHIVGADRTQAMLAALRLKGFSETRVIHKNILLDRHSV